MSTVDCSTAELLRNMFYAPQAGIEPTGLAEKRVYSSKKILKKQKNSGGCRSSF